MTDVYHKLRPAPPTPPDELCSCQDVKEIYLAHKLRANPLHCVTCNREIPPEKLGFGEDFAEKIAFWNWVYGSLYYLWLASGEYEEWARDRLLDPNGEVNETGREIVALLNNTIEAYYLWFREDYESEVATCPVCAGSLLSRENFKFKMCSRCKIII